MTPYMKRILISLLATLLLAAPAAMAIPSEASVARIEKKARKNVTVTYKVNIHCKNCVNKLTDKLSFLKGVEDLKISLDDKTVTITYNPAKTDEASLVKVIEKSGYTAEKQNPKG